VTLHDNRPWWHGCFAGFWLWQCEMSHLVMQTILCRTNVPASFIGQTLKWHHEPDKTGARWNWITFLSCGWLQAPGHLGVKV